jgi:toxin ParE1/3/4
VSPQPRAELAARAEQDLDAIWRYVAGGSGRERADALIRRIAATARIYAERPLAGRAYPELGADVRAFGVHLYLVFYRPEPWGIAIVRVIHGRCDIALAWTDDPSNGS